ncbi:MAG: twitch domain-containing radical SAM protein [Candidatus Promineifilaceae bacterium]|nr:twitch domain-containing radical SAM protein [Candidatus Promineifilaceae bacterium]
MDKSPKNIELPSDSFCILPWVHLFAGELGILRPCCMTLGERDLVNRNAKGDPYVVYHPAGIEEAWNAPFFREIRRDMLNGRRPPVCNRCWRDENLGTRSYRQDSNTIFSHYIAPAVAQTAEDGTAPTSLIHSADFRLGNFCNLRCRMCTPVSSKGLIGEWADFHDLSRDDERLVRLRELDWYSKDHFWSTFEQYIPHIDVLHFAGGEPLIIPQMFDFLERVIAMGRAPEITLSYVTNLTVLPERIFELWPRFKEVKVVVSVDGYDEIDAYIRYPTNWQKLDRNMRLIDTETDRLKCQNLLTFNTTVQVYNIFRLDELLEYAATSFRRFRPPNLSILSYPEYHSIQILPLEMKHQAADRLRHFIERFGNHWPMHWQGKPLTRLLSAVDGIIKHMFSADRSELLPEFRRWTNHLDQTRGQDVCRVIPELAPLFVEGTVTVPIIKEI